MNINVDPETLALESCDSEPIHRPGRVQPFGVLLAGPVSLERVEFISENVAEMLGIEAKDVLGAPFKKLLGKQVVHDLRNLLSLSTARAQRERVSTTQINGRTMEIFAHRNPDDQAVVELEPVSDADEERTAPVDRIRLILAQASQQRDIRRFLNVCVHGLRDLIGYDRVKAYRYEANGDGEVIAESRGPGIDSFFGLRYPAWDVPKQARELQVRNPVRMLSDMDQEPVALLGHSEDPDHLDIALAHLRGISPVHVQYMRNMGVSASLTIGLVVDGNLWGMFACHHHEPKVIRSDVRIAVELFGQLVSLLVQQKMELEASDARARAEEARRRILAETDAAQDLLHAFPELSPILRSVIACDGLAVLREGVIQTAGSVPSEEAITAIGDRLPEEDDLLEGVDCLLRSGWAGENDIRESAGCLVIRCTAIAPLQLVFFRDRKTRTVRWAGAPQKQIEKDGTGTRLEPRASFASYLEEQKDMAQEWSAVDMEAAKQLQRLLTQIASKGERAQLQRHRDLVTYQRQQDLMIAELNHRVKNILALIRSLSRQAKSSSASLEAYAQSLEQRISALAAAHDLAVRNDREGVSLRNVLETELRPYMVEESNQVLLAGPPAGLRPDVAPMIALVFHEIVTNAAKYGALSTPEGMVNVRWNLEEDGLHLSWTELGGPTVAPPQRQGFGRSLIEKVIPYEFEGHVEVEYAPSGFRMTFSLPPQALADVTEEQEVKLVGQIGRIESVALGRIVLLVEDNMVLAMDMVESLTSLGADRVETAASVEEALKVVRMHDFDFAVLDLNLRGAVSFDVARRLSEQGTPFVFATGYGTGASVPPEFADVPLLTKPVEDGSLSLAIREMLEAASKS